MLLSGQVPMGELLAAPSADLLDGIAFCVLDGSPESRRERLRARGWPEDGLIHHVRFGEWFVAHAQDPQHAPDVITVDSGGPMRWDRWGDWRAGDPRWNATIINTDEHSIDETAAWVELSWTTWSSQYGTAGHLPISDDWTTAQADDPAYEPLFKLYQDLYAKEIIAKQPLSPYGDATPLGEGKLASMTAGSWAVSQLLADWPDMVPNLAAAPMASVDGDPSRTTSTLGGWTIGVDAKSQKIEAAAKAISWMMAEDAVLPKDYFVKTSYTKLSPRVSIAEDLADDPERSENPFYDQIVDATKTAILEPTYDWQVSLAMGTALEKAMDGEDIKAVQAEANKTITYVIAELNLPEQLK